MNLRSAQALGLLLLCGGANATSLLPVADYTFNNSLSSTAVGAPDLTFIGSNHLYQNDSVYGAAQTVLTFAAGTGVQLVPTTQILSDPGTYTIIITVRHNNPGGGFSKYIDVANGSVDYGLYDRNEVLGYYTVAAGAYQLIAYDYEDIAISRDATGRLKGYLNGMPQFSGDDSATRYGVITAANTLRFFVDDSVQGTEQSDGAVARLRIWNAALSDQEVATESGYVTPTLVADYEGSLTSSVGPVPDLAEVGTIGTASEQAYYYLPAQNVLTFLAGNGLALNPVSALLPSGGRYTIALRARITNTSTDHFSKLIDLSNGSADVGLYVDTNFLDFYSYPFASGVTVGSGYGDIVLSRDRSGAVFGYYNGVPQFQTTDLPNQWAAVSAADTLRFFLDDSVGGGNEASPGAVASIRIWSDFMSPAEVQQLTDAIFHDGFEGP